MNIPERWQVFEDKVVIHDWQLAELQPILASWETLAAALKAGLTTFTIRRLIVLELMGKGRWKLIERLLMRHGRMHRKDLTKAIQARLLCS